MRKKGPFSRKLGARGGGLCATNLAEMAVKIALRSATQCATELRLETLVTRRLVRSIIYILESAPFPRQAVHQQLISSQLHFISLQTVETSCSAACRDP